MRKIGFLSLALATALFAETRLETSVISTTGFEASVADEVRNINVVTKDDIEKRSDSDLKTVLRRAPGVHLQQKAFGDAIDMRGQGIRANTSVQVMVNGIAMNMTDSSHSAMPLDAFSIDDIERVEIMPGGGSVLYGSGTQGGVVNIITKTKPKDFYANIATRYAQRGSINGRLNIGGMASENLFLKASLYSHDTKGYRDGDKSRGTYGSLGAIYQILDNQQLSINYSYFDGRSHFGGSATRAMLDRDRKSTSGDVSVTDVEMTNLNIDYSVKFKDNWELKISPFYQYTKFEPEGSSRFNDKKYGVRAKVKHDYSYGSLIFGYDYIYNKGKNDGAFDFMLNPMMRFVNITKGDTKKTTHSAFLQNRFDITDEFSLTAGYRYDYADYEVGKHTFTKVGPASMFNMIPGTLNTLDLNKNENNYAFEITPNYQYSDTGNVYFKFERGFTSPSANKMQNKDALIGYYPSNIDSETFQTYELGMKDLLFGQYFQATLFYTKSKDEISTVGKPPQFWNQVNIGKTERWGFEVYSEQDFMDGDLRLSQSFAYIDAEVKEVGVSGFRVGDVIPNVAKYKISLGVDYDITPYLTLFLDSKFYGDQKNSSYEKISSYNVTDVGARYKYKNLTITGGIDNVFDKEYYHSVSGSGANKSYYVGDGRTAYLEFKYDF
ncbi:MAG: TonB-dependent receptor [Campylobacteraceae bacterium]|nr:TonB-dependent receptor [Campylobacteraceae bacterium]